MSLIGKLNPIFKNAVIATAGDFPHKDYTDANIARWVKYREGRFSQELGDTVTHLVCTREEFKRRTPKGECDYAPKPTGKTTLTSVIVGNHRFHLSLFNSVCFFFVRLNTQQSKQR